MAKTATKVTKTTAKSVKTTKVSNTNLHKVTNQTAFLEKYLRGTGRTLSVAQAKANYGIKNLSARICDLRDAGLVVYTDVNTTGKASYRMVARDVKGSRAYKFAK